MIIKTYKKIFCFETINFSNQLHIEVIRSIINTRLISLGFHTLLIDIKSKKNGHIPMVITLRLGLNDFWN